jgi:hypothetical protein
MLVRALREMAEENDIGWARDFFFLHTIRGTKHGTQHDPTSTSARNALQEYLEDAKIPEDALEEGEWWIDVGLELMSQSQQCLQWRTDSHYHLVQHFLQIETNHAVRITRPGSSKYSRDLVSHLMGISGCRIEPGSQAEGPHGVVYYQQYTTDKSITYNPEGGHHGKAITMDQAMGKTQPPTFVTNLLELYDAAGRSNPSHARIEVRVPIRNALKVLMRWSPDIIRQSVLLFPSVVWW